LILPQVCKRWNQLTSVDGLWFLALQQKFHRDPFLVRKQNQLWKEIFIRKFQADKRWKQGTFCYFKELREHEDLLISLELKGDTLVSSSDDRTIKIWDLIKYECVATLSDPELSSECYTTVYNPNIIIGGFYDSTIRIFNIETQKRTSLLGKPTHQLGRGVCWTLLQDNDHLYSGHWNGTIRLWDLNSEKWIREFKATGPVSCLRLDKSTLVAATYLNYVQKWDSRSQSPMISSIQSEHFRGTVDHIKLEGDRAISSLRSSIDLWDINTGKIIHNIKKSSRTPPLCIEFDGEKIICGTLDSTVEISDFFQEKYKFAFPASGEVECLQYDWNKLVCGTWDANIILWSFDEELTDE